MGRLFWKFFFFIWLAQLTALFGIAAYNVWERRQIEARIAARFAELGVPMPEGAPFRRPWDGPPHRVPGMPPDHIPGPPPKGMRDLPGGPERFDFPGPPGPFGGPGPRGPYGPALMRGPGPHFAGLPVVPLGIGLLASLVFAALLARYFSRPIRSLSGAFDAAARGDLSVRVGAAMRGREDELADLGRDFDRMSERLEALIDGQRRLLHDVSHEMRSPLARLQAAIGLARQQPARRDAALARIETESERIDRLIGELLTLSRLEAGMATPHVEPVDIGELVAAIVEDARFESGGAAASADAVAAGAAVADASAADIPAADAAPAVDIRCDVFAGLLVAGDAELLHRAIENVVRNALKFSAPGSCVEVAARAAGDAVEVVVEDRGPGVPQPDLERIFLPFYRSEGAHNAVGHGLGLAIAAHVATAHGGSIAARNRVGGGLAVTLRLPRASAPS